MTANFKLLITLGVLLCSTIARAQEFKTTKESIASPLYDINGYVIGHEEWPTENITTSIKLSLNYIQIERLNTTQTQKVKKRYTQNTSMYIVTERGEVFVFVKNPDNTLHSIVWKVHDYRLTLKP